LKGDEDITIGEKKKERGEKRLAKLKPTLASGKKKKCRTRTRWRKGGEDEKVDLTNEKDNTVCPKGLDGGGLNHYSRGWWNEHQIGRKWLDTGRAFAKGERDSGS